LVLRGEGTREQNVGIEIVGSWTSSRAQIVALDRVLGDSLRDRCIHVVQGYVETVILNGALSCMESQQMRVVGQPFGQEDDFLDRLRFRRDPSPRASFVKNLAEFAA
jgi:hypothetical protein